MVNVKIEAKMAIMIHEMEEMVGKTGATCQ